MRFGHGLALALFSGWFGLGLFCDRYHACVDTLRNCYGIIKQTSFNVFTGGVVAQCAPHSCFEPQTFGELRASAGLYVRH